MTDTTKTPFDNDAAQPVQPGMTGTSNEGIDPEGKFSTQEGEIETLTPTDEIEGSTLKQDEETEQSGGFVGSESQDDTSSELVENREQFQAPDGQ